MPSKIYIFIEHIRPENSLGKVFDKINVIWKRNSFGCQINRNILNLIYKTNLNVSSNILYYVLCFGTAQKKDNEKVVHNVVFTKSALKSSKKSAVKALLMGFMSDFLVCFNDGLVL